MKPFFKHYAYAIPVSVLALAAGAFRTHQIFRCIEPDTGLYRHAADNDIFAGMVIAMTLIILGFYLIARKETPARPLAFNLPVRIFALAASLFFFGQIALLFNAGKPGVLFTVEILLCLPAAVSFFLLFLHSGKNADETPVQSVLPLCPVFAAALRIIRIFIDTDHPINASERSYHLVALVVLLLFLLTESRFFIPSYPSEEASEKAARRTAAYRLACLGSAVVTVMFLLPHLIGCAYGLYPWTDAVSYAAEALVGGYALCRLCAAE